MGRKLGTVSLVVGQRTGHLLYKATYVCGNKVVYQFACDCGRKCYRGLKYLQQHADDACCTYCEHKNSEKSENEEEKVEKSTQKKELQMYAATDLQGNTFLFDREPYWNGKRWTMYQESTERKGLPTVRVYDLDVPKGSCRQVTITKGQYIQYYKAYVRRQR